MSRCGLVQVIMKSAAEESIEKRIRRCWLASALVAFSQGIAFFHAGDEILRSKSLDRDSYNSGAGLNPDLCNQTLALEYGDQCFAACHVCWTWTCSMHCRPASSSPLRTYACRGLVQ